MADLLGLPTLASEHGARIDQLIVLVHILMIVLFVGWGCFFVYCLVRFRAKKNPKADGVGVKSHTSTYLEVAVVVVEIVLLVGFSIPFWIAEVDALPLPEENPFEVRIVAQQYAWNVHYPGPDGVFGRTDIDLIDDVENPLGLDRKDPNAQDDVVSLNFLRLPVDRQTLIRLTSRDVIHSFSVPEFRVKQDALPGMSIPVHFTPTLTTQAFREAVDDPARSFEIVCSQLCGLGHYRMRGFVLVDTETAILDWILSQQ